MSGQERQLFLLPITIAGILGAFLLLSGLTIWMSFFLKKPIGFGDAIFSAILGLPLGLWFGLRFLQIIRSAQRYNARVKT